MIKDRPLELYLLFEGFSLRARIKKESYEAFLGRLNTITDEQLVEVTGMLELIFNGSYKECKRIWDLPGASWKMYDVMGIKDLKEQILLKAALTIFKNELIKVMKHVKSIANPKRSSGIPVQSEDGQVTESSS